VQLSQNLFAEITGVKPGASSNCELQSDRRSHPRIAFDRRARIFPLMEGVGEAGTAVLVRDISVGGIGFLYAEPIGVGDEFVIRLFTPSDEPIDIQCAARRCEMSGTCGSQFAVGATFELVLNRPISTSVAPESEMATDQEPLLDQPAPPTIEQRYEHQCVTSRLIRPLIRETRWDRWIAKPRVQKIFRLLTRIFWPALLLWKAINSVLQAGEESRIRNRLTPNKSGKKRRVKSPRSIKLPPQETVQPAIQTTPALDVPSPQTSTASCGATGHASLFNNAQATAAAGEAPLPLVEMGSRRSSLFTKDEVEPSASSPVAPLAAAPAPATEPVAAVEPIAQVESMVATEALAVTATPPIEVEVNVYAEPQPAPEPVRPASVEMLNPQPPTQSEEARLPSSSIDQNRSSPPSSHARPPVAHPRQLRRRMRPTFHR